MLCRIELGWVLCSYSIGDGTFFEAGLSRLRHTRDTHVGHINWWRDSKDRASVNGWGSRYVVTTSRYDWWQRRAIRTGRITLISVMIIIVRPRLNDGDGADLLIVLKLLSARNMRSGGDSEGGSGGSSFGGCGSVLRIFGVFNVSRTWLKSNWSV